ncbi:leucine-rich repeat protein [Flammeovirga aprica]|uniref:Leucine-rich repeat protein n=1 Tax=Flammeovirga aprica JL-4 TaxID=694437 RepID=A0A7X9RYT5_9BACT|nr:leucine-rich repeat protein [Flammeovirga aprica]NME71211.1 leucine-rich repeat protein [Flammeovirga aprica JL-4]
MTNLTSKLCVIAIVILYAFNQLSAQTLLSEKELSIDSEGVITLNQGVLLDTDIIIPSEINGQSVISIGSYTFQGKGITSVQFPETLEIINFSSFANNNIKKLELPENLKIIESYAFSDNELTDPVVFNGTVVEKIGLSAFKHKKGTNIPENVIHRLPDYKKKGYELNGWIQLPTEGKYFPEGYPISIYHSYVAAIKYIGLTLKGHILGYAFPIDLEVRGDVIEDIQLKNGEEFSITVDFGSNITLTPKNKYLTFETESITLLNIQNNIDTLNFYVEYHTITDEDVESNREGDLILDDRLPEDNNYIYFGRYRTNIIIPDTLKGESVKRLLYPPNDLNVSAVKLPNTLEEIHRNYFENNNMLKKINLPESLLKIESYAFKNTGLKQLKLPSNLEFLGKEAFGDTEISTIELPNSLKTFHLDAFKNTNIKTVFLPENSQTLYQDTWIVVDNPSVVFGAGEEVEVGTGYILNHKIEFTGVHVEVANTTKETINFNYNSSDDQKIEVTLLPFETYTIEEVKGFSSTINVLETNGIELNQSIHTLNNVQENTLITIEEAGYYTLKDEDVVMVGQSISSLVLEELPNSKIIIPTILQKEIVKGISSDVFKEKNITEVILPEYLEEIYTDAFKGNHLRSINLPKSLTYISYGVFENNKLTTIKFPAKLRVLHKRAFANNRIRTVEIPLSIKELSEDLFKNNRIDSLYIPPNIEVIGNGAFKNNSIRKLSFGESSKLELIYSEAFQYNNLQQLILPEGVIKIYDDAFSFNELNDLKLPNSLEIIGEGVFRNNKLVSLVIPNNVYHIKYRSFQNNHLKTVTFPQSLNDIGAYAFENNFIEEVDIPDGIESLRYGTFLHNSLTKVKLPKQLNTIASKVFDDNMPIRLPIYYMEGVRNIWSPIIDEENPFYDNERSYSVYKDNYIFEEGYKKVTIKYIRNEFCKAKVIVDDTDEIHLNGPNYATEYKYNFVVKKVGEDLKLDFGMVALPEYLDYKIYPESLLLTDESLEDTIQVEVEYIQKATTRKEGNVHYLELGTSYNYLPVIHELSADSSIVLFDLTNYTKNGSSNIRNDSLHITDGKLKLHYLNADISNTKIAKEAYLKSDKRDLKYFKISYEDSLYIEKNSHPDFLYWEHTPTWINEEKIEPFEEGMLMATSNYDYDIIILRAYFKPYVVTSNDVTIKDGLITSYNVTDKHLHLVIPDSINGQLIRGVADSEIGIFEDLDIWSLSLPDSFIYYGSNSFKNNDINNFDCLNFTNNCIFKESSFEGNLFLEYSRSIRSFQKIERNAFKNIYSKVYVIKTSDYFYKELYNPDIEYEKEVFYRVPLNELTIENGYIVNYHPLQSHSFIKLPYKDSEGFLIKGIIDAKNKEEGVFNNKGLEGVEMYNEYIGDYAFSDNDIFLIKASNVKHIGKDAFRNNSISSPYKLDKVNYIGKGAFSENPDLSFKFPSNPLLERGYHHYGYWYDENNEMYFTDSLLTDHSHSYTKYLFFNGFTVTSIIDYPDYNNIAFKAYFYDQYGDLRDKNLYPTLNKEGTYETTFAKGDSVHVHYKLSEHFESENQDFFITSIDSDTTIYFDATPKEHSIEYENLHGAYNEHNPTSFTIFDEVEFEDLVHNEWGFINWTYYYVSDEDSVIHSIYGPRNFYGDIILKAHWYKKNPTDINDELFESVILSPNPASSHITVLNFPIDNSSTFKVYNLSGQLVLNGTFSNGNIINIESLQSGVYILDIVSVKILKFIKQ